MPPLISYPITGSVKDSRDRLQSSVQVRFTNLTKDSNGLTPLFVTTNSDGIYTADAANFTVGYDLNDSVQVFVLNSFQDESKTDTFTISESSKNLDLVLEVIESLQKGTASQISPVVLTNVNKKPFTKINPFPVSTGDIRSEYVNSDSDTDQEPEYWGYVDRFGNWFIEEINRTNGTYRFARGPNNYSANWTNRTDLDYKYWYEVF